MAEGWDLAAEVRTDAADLVEGLSAEQRDGTTLCTGWTPHHVLAHLVTFVDVPLPKFMFNVVKAGGNFDKAADRMARSIAERAVEELAATLRERGSKKSAFPGFPPELTISDVAVHTQDIRRGLGLAGQPSEQVLRTTLDFLTGDKKAKLICDPKKQEGLRLGATDIDWSSGEGDEVRGPAEALMMALTGRPTHDDLEGAVDRLR